MQIKIKKIQDVFELQPKIGPLQISITATVEPLQYQLRVDLAKILLAKVLQT
jgi:hypothetical protein